MDDERWESGMPVLDRQPVRVDRPTPLVAAGAVDGPTPTRGAAAAVAGAAGAAAGAVADIVAGTASDGALPPSLRGLPPRSVPELSPTPLQKHYVLLSAPALVAGAIGITALEMGAGLGSWLVKLCVLVAAPLLLVTTADATVRIWRSAWSWMPVDRGRGMFRLAWVVASIVFLALIVSATVLVLGA